MWLWLAILSAFLLGFYDVARKWSLRENAVLPVIFLSICIGALLVSVCFILSRVMPGTMMRMGLYATVPSATLQGYIFFKAVLVSITWICAYTAIKHLPISIVAPIRSSSPVWTLVGAVLLFGERMSLWQWAGLLITFGSYYVFSLLGKREGIHFKKNKWMFLVFLAVITGAASALYDKYLLQRLLLSPVTLQTWFSFYLVVTMGCVCAVFYRPSNGGDRFQWRWSIVLIGVFIILSDFTYFNSLAQKDALVSIVSTVRRSSVVVAFVFGGLLFKEKNKRKKAIPLIGVLVGLLLLLMKSA